ncbi:unnamed protein product, partial [Polarella glacialis]
MSAAPGWSCGVQVPVEDSWSETSSWHLPPPPSPPHFLGTLQREEVTPVSGRRRVWDAPSGPPLSLLELEASEEDSQDSLDESTWLTPLRRKSKSKPASPTKVARLGGPSAGTAGGDSSASAFFLNLPTTMDGRFGHDPASPAAWGRNRPIE